jgi:ribulose-5-phosphate 4-epimerase/fuculose-1-phosphate aldolase
MAPTAYTGTFEPPQFDTVEETRAHRKNRLAAAYRIFSRLGYDHWVAGHITVRDPGHPDRFWVNPFGRSWRHVSASDLLLVDGDGTVLEGDAPLNGAAFAIHSEVHRARPDVTAVAHAHTTYGRAWSATGRGLEPLSQDACAFYDDLAVFDDYTGVVYDPDEGGALARALGSRKAMLLQHHGLLTVGESVDEAAFWLHLLERCCQAQILVSTLPAVEGAPPYRALDDEIAKRTWEQVGQHHHGWMGFQPLYEEIVADQPDLLD